MTPEHHDNPTPNTLRDRTCREVIEFLDDFVSRRLPADQMAEFEAHLGICPACRDFLKTYSDTIALSRGAMKEAAGQGAARMPEDLVKAVLAARRP